MDLTTRYWPGPWCAVVQPGRVALLSQEFTTLLGTLLPEDGGWQRLWAGRDLDAVRGLLLAAGSGNGSTVPGFALVEATGEKVRCFAAGDARLDVVDANGQASSVDAATPESVIELLAPFGVRLAGPRSRGAAYDQAGYVLEAGVVPVSEVMLSRVLLPALPEAQTLEVPSNPDVDVPEHTVLSTKWHVPSPNVAMPTPALPAPGAPPAAPLIEAVPTEFASVGMSASVEVPPTDLDHDGHTILSGDVAVVRETSRGLPQPSEALLDAPAVAPLPPFEILTLGQAIFSSGEVYELDRSLIIGRRPRFDRVGAADLPQLIPVPSPNRDISRSHVEFRVTQGRVLLVDLGATNGSALYRGGEAPRRLGLNEAVELRDGDVVSIGEGITIRIALTAAMTVGGIGDHSGAHVP